MDYALEAQGVTKVYGTGTQQVRAVDDVSLQLARGEFVALVGPSGSGKTTMLAMLAGLLSPTDGSIRLDGREYATLKESQRAELRRQKIGFTFQANNLVGYLTAQENVELMLRLNGQLTKKTRDRARELLARLGLEDRLGNLPRQLSGGQQQRVAIARSLINNPALVLADEPTASLDTDRAYQVVQTMADLIHEEDRVGVLVTHDLRMVEYCDRVIQMVDGQINQIITEGPAISCFSNPANCEQVPLDVLITGAEAESVGASVTL